MEGRHLLLDIDIKGGINVKRAYPEQSVSIFIQPPSAEVLERRLRKRGTDTPEQIRIRMERMPEEMQLGQQFDYQIINDDLEQAIDAFSKILINDVYHQ